MKGQNNFRDEPVVDLFKVFLNVYGMLFVQLTLVANDPPQLGSVTQLIGNRNSRQIPQIGKAADDSKNAQNPFGKVTFELDGLSCAGHFRYPPWSEGRESFPQSQSSVLLQNRWLL